MKNFLLLLGVCLVATQPSRAQLESLNLGGAKITLGMPGKSALNAVSEYNISKSSDTSYIITQSDKATKIFSTLGVIGITNETVTFISRSLDTSGWPDDEGFSTAMALYHAISAAIPLTNSDGSKRATAEITITNNDISSPITGSIRMIELVINQSEVTLMISDASDGKDVSASISIRSKK